MENPLADIDQVERIADPVERAKECARRLDAIPRYQVLLAKWRREAVLELRARQPQPSYAEIGAMLGLHRNTVQQIAEGPPGARKRARGTSDPE